MAKYILRHGSEKPTDNAYICPNCGCKMEKYELLEQAYHNPDRAVLRCSVMGMMFIRPLAPTFTCTQCGCIWQWEEDEPKTEAQKSNIPDIGNIDDINKDMKFIPEEKRQNER